MWEGLSSFSLEEGGKTHLTDTHYVSSVVAYSAFPINFVILFPTNSGPESSGTTEATRPTPYVPRHSMLSLPSFLPLTSRQHPLQWDHSLPHVCSRARNSERKQLLFFPCTPYPCSYFLLQTVIRKCQKWACIRRPTPCTWTSHLRLSSTSMGLLEQTLSRWREIHGDLGRPSHFPEGAFTPWQVIYPGAWPGPVNPPSAWSFVQAWTSGKPYCW